MERFDGLLEHLEARLGVLRTALDVEVDGQRSGYSLVVWDLADPGITTVSTNGLRFQPVRSVRPQELVCSLDSDQVHIARYFVNSLARRIVASGHGLEYDTVVTIDGALVAGTQIAGLLAIPSPYFGPSFDLLLAADGDPILQLMTIVPITAAEADFVAECDSEELYDLWRENRTNILDVNRPSVL